MLKTEIKNGVITGLAFVLGLFIFTNAQACESSRDPRANYFISYDRPYAGLFADGAAVKNIHPTIIDKCEGSAGEFLMISLALRTQKQNGMTADLNFDKNFRNDSCKITNNPFPIAQTYADRNAAFQNQYNILRSCTYLDIVNIDDNEIALPDTQPAANVEIVTKSHIRATGDFVYLKLDPKARFAIGIGLKKECTNITQVKAMGLQPGDVSAILNTYEAGDASGLTEDLTPIGSTRVRLALTPSSDLMSISSADEPAETPSWPSVYKTGVEFGTLSIRTAEEGKSSVSLMPIVDNFSPLRCHNGICSSENSFQQPLSGLVELVDVTNGYHKVVDSWYFGATVPAQYQGLVMGALPKLVDPGVIKIGNKYAVEMTMVDPYEDYLLFKTGLSQMIVDLSDMGSSVAGLDIMGQLGGLSSVMGTKSLSGLGDINADPSQAISDAMDELNDYQTAQDWPPYFDSTCNGKNGACYGRGKVKFIKKIGAQFTVGEIQPDQSYGMQGLTVYSADPAMGTQVRVNQMKPFYDCSGSDD